MKTSGPSLGPTSTGFSRSHGNPRNNTLFEPQAFEPLVCLSFPNLSCKTKFLMDCWWPPTERRKVWGLLWLYVWLCFAVLLSWILNQKMFGDNGWIISHKDRKPSGDAGQVFIGLKQSEPWRSSENQNFQILPKTRRPSLPLCVPPDFVQVFWKPWNPHDMSKRDLPFWRVVLLTFSWSSSAVSPRFWFPARWASLERFLSKFRWRPWGTRRRS